MNTKEIVENIFQMEEDLDLFSKKIGNVHFWELVRFDLYVQIALRTGNIEQAGPKLDLNLENVSKYLFNAVMNIFYKNPFLDTKSEILFIGTGARKKMEDGLWWDVYFDHVLESLESSHKCLFLESPGLNKHMTPCKTSHIRYLDLVIFIEALLRKTKLMRVSLNNREQAIIRKIESEINYRFNVNFDLKKFVLKQLRTRKIMMPIYTILFKIIQPRIIIIICSYGKESLIEVCKKMAIPVIELQHGTISRYHVGYSFPCNKSLKRTFPDYFLVFGEYWKNIVEFPIPKKNVISVGYPFFDIEKEKYDHEPKKNQIVFISQWTIAEKMSRFAVDLAAIKKFPLDIVYKLHPREYEGWKKKYPWLKEAGVSVIDDDSIPLYRLLATSKALVGVSSTVVYEGLGIGLMTFLLDLPGIEHMDELINAQAVTVVSTVDELVEKFEQLDQRRSNPVFYFLPNGLQNIFNVLDQIIGGFSHK